MGIILKLLANPQVRAVVQFLWAWLVSSAGKALLTYGGEALEIVKAASNLTKEDGTPLTGAEKRKWATDRLIEQAKIDGKSFVKYELENVVQTVYTKWQAEGAK